MSTKIQSRDFPGRTIGSESLSADILLLCCFPWWRVHSTQQSMREWFTNPVHNIYTQQLDRASRRTWRPAKHGCPPHTDLSRSLCTIIEVLHNLFEASVDLFRYPTTGRRAKWKEKLETPHKPNVHYQFHSFTNPCILWNRREQMQPARFGLARKSQLKPHFHLQTKTDASTARHSDYCNRKSCDIQMMNK